MPGTLQILSWFNKRKAEKPDNPGYKPLAKVQNLQCELNERPWAIFCFQSVHFDFTSLNRNDSSNNLFLNISTLLITSNKPRMAHQMANLDVSNSFKTRKHLVYDFIFKVRKR